MKRVLSLILSLSLSLCLAACADKTNESSTAAQTTKTTTTEAAVPQTTATTAPATTEVATTAAATEVATTEAATEAATMEAATTQAAGTESNESASIRGKTSDDGYVNEALKLRIAKPEAWTIYSDEQIAQSNNMTLELFKDTDISEYIKNSGYYIDTMMGTLNGDNLNLVIQPSNPLLALVSDEDLYKSSKEEFTQQLAAANMQISTYETLSMQVGGKERKVLHIGVSFGSLSFDEYQIWYRENPDYCGILTVTIMSGADPKPILDGITTLD